MYTPRKLQISEMSLAAPLFEGWDETLIWSCLQGVMGEVYAVEGENGTLLAQAVLSDFCFFAGNAGLAGYDAAAALAKNDVYTREIMIFVPQNDGWSRVIETAFPGRCSKFTRYAFEKNTEFDRTRLQSFLHSVPEGFSVVPIDRRLYDLSHAFCWSKDLCSQYADWEEYDRCGLGFMALHDGEPVAGASSYSYYNGGIEIEIDTREDFRRLGLAAACASALILECLGRGLYPSWDAANEISVSLAKKLGYRFSHAYTAYVVTGFDKK